MNRRFHGLLMIFVTLPILWSIHHTGQHLAPARQAGNHGNAASPHGCTIKTSKYLTQGGQGLTWSPRDRNTFIYTNYDANKVTQLYQWDLRTGTSRCLTCVQTTGGPPAYVNKGVPTYDPRGRFIVLQATMPSHQGEPGTTPGAGYYQNLWAWNPRSGKWFNLTNFPATGIHGVLLARISPDGTKIAWAELYRRAPLSLLMRYVAGQTLQGPLFGYWQLRSANIISDSTSIRLSNIQTYQPGNADFYETQDWAPDSKSLLFASDIGTGGPYQLNVWRLNLATGDATQVIRYKGQWTEHATFTRNGKGIIYMSTACCHVDFTNLRSFLNTFETELYIARADGLQSVQLTHFNTSPAAGERFVSDKVYRQPSASNTYLLEQQYFDRNGRNGSRVLMLSLTGNCDA